VDYWSNTKWGPRRGWAGTPLWLPFCTGSRLRPASTARLRPRGQNTDEDNAHHAAQQRAYLLDLASGNDGDRWQHGATDAGVLQTEYAVASIGDDLSGGVDVTV
jgi:hypothetical protein